MTRLFLDTEFHEDGKTIDLISIAIADEDRSWYYAISREFDVLKAWRNDWLRQNVLPHIFDHFYGELKGGGQYPEFTYLNLRTAVKSWGKSRDQIASEVYDFYLRHCFPNSSKVEFWADYASYDWVALCQLFGTMVQLPHGFPMYCHDFQQELKRHPSELVDLLPKPLKTGLHDALQDAFWLRDTFSILRIATEERFELGEIADQVAPAEAYLQKAESLPEGA